jgi:hypothetical protein
MDQGSEFFTKFLPERSGVFIGADSDSEAGAADSLARFPMLGLGRAGRSHGKPAMMYALGRHAHASGAAGESLSDSDDSERSELESSEGSEELYNQQEWEDMEAIQVEIQDLWVDAVEHELRKPESRVGYSTKHIECCSYTFEFEKAVRNSVAYVADGSVSWKAAKRTAREELYRQFCHEDDEAREERFNCFLAAARDSYEDTSREAMDWRII